jgi:Na+-driven multidrug efflux pump
MIPVGIQVSASVLTGNNVGANKITVAKEYAQMCVRTAIIWAIAMIGILIVMRDPFTSIFTNDSEVFNIIG